MISTRTAAGRKFTRRTKHGLCFDSRHMEIHHVILRYQYMVINKNFCKHLSRETQFLNVCVTTLKNRDLSSARVQISILPEVQSLPHSIDNERRFYHENKSL